MTEKFIFKDLSPLGDNSSASNSNASRGKIDPNDNISDTPKTTSGAFVLKDLSPKSVDTILPADTEVQVATTNESDNMQKATTEAMPASSNGEVNTEEITPPQKTDTQSSYDQGYAEAKAHLEDMINQNKIDYNFNKKLSEILDALDPKRSLDLHMEYANVISEILHLVCEKMLLEFPVNFVDIIGKQLKQMLDASHNDGKISIKVSEDRLQYCKDLFNDTLSTMKSENLSLVSDSTLTTNDCVIVCNDSTLVYSQDSIKAEVETMFQQFGLKHDSKNTSNDASTTPKSNNAVAENASIEEASSNTGMDENPTTISQIA